RCVLCTALPLPNEQGSLRIPCVWHCAAGKRAHRPNLLPCPYPWTLQQRVWPRANIRRVVLSPRLSCYRYVHGHHAEGNPRRGPCRRGRVSPDISLGERPSGGAWCGDRIVAYSHQLVERAAVRTDSNARRDCSNRPSRHALLPHYV